MHYRITSLFVVFALLTPYPAFAQDGSYSMTPGEPALACTGGVSTSFDITGDVIHPQTFRLRDLQAIVPSTTVQDYFVAGSSTTQGEFRGVLLWNLLNLVGVEVNPAIKNDLDRKYIVVTGTDCYQGIFSMGEIDPSLSGSDQVTVTYAQWMNGHLTGLGTNGFARIIIPADKKGARRVSNIDHIEVISVPPPPP